MEAFYEFLVAQPDRLRVRPGFKGEGLIGLLRQSSDPRTFRLGLFAGLLGPCIVEQIERVDKDLFGLLLGPALAARGIFTEFPGWPMADCRILLVGQDRGIAHSGEIIVGLIIFPDVIEAKLPKTAFRMPPLGCAMGPRLRTARMLAARRLRFGAAPAASRRNTDLVVEFRLRVHERLIVGPEGPKQVLRRQGEVTHIGRLRAMSMSETKIRDRIEAKLRASFAPTHLVVTDDSHQHAGHSGARPGGQTHFSVQIVSAAFQGKSRIECHRAINALLVQEFADGVHALAISARAP
jgi:BolA family transcriptional regulator, general stress-responsive regulator